MTTKFVTAYLSGYWTAQVINVDYSVGRGRKWYNRAE